MKQFYFACLAILASVAGASGKVPQICGSVVSSDVSGHTAGVYKIPTEADGVFQLLGATEAASGGGVMADGTYYATSYVDKGFYAEVKIYPYNTDTWQKVINTYIYGSYTNLSSDMAVDPSTGTIYGALLSSSRDKWELATVSFNLENESCSKSPIAPLEKQMSALAFDAGGQLYGIDTDGVLYKVNKTDASLQMVGDTGIATKVDASGYAPTNPASGVIDPASGLMYWAVVTTDNKSQLYKVNLSSAQATPINTFAGNEVIRGLYISQPEAEDGAPAAPTELSASFAPGSLSGNVVFKAPTQTYGGEPLSGNLNFKVLANGEQVGSGTVYTGVSRSVEVSMPSVGEYEISVILSNSVGDSPAAKIKAYVGYSAPATPEVTVRDYYGSLKVEWTPVTTTASGEPLGDATVTYRVVRYPDNAVVADGTTDTSLIDRIPESNEAVAYRYGVTAIVFGTPSEEGMSSKIVTGQMTPPYTEGFPTKESLDKWTITDANGDGYTWSFYNGEMRAQANSSTAADDWLISPPVAIEGFSYYVVSVDVKSESASYPGKFELKYGTSPTPEAMTTTLIEPTVITHEGYVTYKANLRIIGENKNYYFGIHALTEADMWWFRATNFAVSAPISGSAPAAPELTVVPDFNGGLSAAITVIPPQKSISGETLSSIDKLEIFRDGSLIHTATSVSLNTEVKCTDSNILEKGIHRYTAVATNSNGTGAEAQTSVFIGINIPASPDNVTAYETSTNGEVTITWDAPATYIDGTPLNADLVTYNIYTPINGVDTKILTDIKGNSTTFQAIFPGEEQIFFYYGVTAQTEAGENTEMALTEQLPLGDPYKAPYDDSFANVSTDYQYGTGAVDNQTYWDFYSDNSFEDVKSQDGDNGMFAMYGSDRGKWAQFSTGKIDLTGLAHPMLTFYTYNMVGNLPDDNTIEVLVNDRSGFVSAGKWKLSDFVTEGWHRIEIPLDQYAGKDVRFKIIGTVDTYQYTHIDNIQLRDRLAHDIAITAISAPERIKAGNEGTIAVDYRNYGLETADAFTIELFRDGEKIDSKEISAFESDATGTALFNVRHDVTTTDKVIYKATVTYVPDLNTANNSSESITIATIFPNYPTVTDLKASYSEAEPLKVVLNWSAPQLTGSFEEEITDDFESYEAWTTSEIGSWELIDEDMGGIYGFGSYFEMPGIPTGSQQSFWVMNDTYQPMVDHFSSPDFYVAHSGHQYLAQMSVMNGDNSVKCDDWAISPQLCGRAQTISLFARSFFDTDPETFELLYSTSGSDISDFQLLETKKNVPNTWTQYYFDLPEGATYFAIRCVSRDCFMLMIDDVTYTPSGEGSDLVIDGYNAYRDGVRINESLITGTTFTTDRPDQNSHVYTVTTVYRNRGESQFSNEAIPDLSGIGQIEAPEKVTVSAGEGEIIIANAENMRIAVYGIDGRTIHVADGTGLDHVAVTDGAYIVVVGNRAFKILVK